MSKDQIANIAPTILAKLAEQAYIIYSNRNKQIVDDINESWLKAKQEAKITTESLIPQKIFSDTKAIYSCSEEYLKMQQQLSTTHSTGKAQIGYRENIKSARETLLFYKKLRLDRSILSMRKGKKNDPLDYVQNILQGILTAAQNYDGGLEFSNQSNVVKFIQLFLQHDGEKGEDRRSHFEQAKEHLNTAYEYLEIMHKNEFAAQSLENIGSKSRDIAIAALKLIIIAVQPTDPTFTGIDRIDIKEFARNGVIKRQLARDDIVQLNKKNPFYARLKSVAYVMNDDKDPRYLSSAAEIPSYNSKELFSRYLSVNQFHFRHPPIIQRIEKRVTESSAKFYKLNEKGIENRLAQFHRLIRFTCQMSHLSSLAFLLSKHAKNYGEVNFYTEKNTQLLLLFFSDLFNLSKKNFNRCEDLFTHIITMKGCLSLTRKYDSQKSQYHKFYTEMAGIDQIEIEVRKLEEAKKESSIIEGKANENEQACINLVTQLSSLYGIKVKNLTIDKNGINTPVHTNQSMNPSKEEEKIATTNLEDKFCTIKDKVLELSPNSMIGGQIVSLMFTTRAIDDVKLLMRILMKAQEKAFQNIPSLLLVLSVIHGLTQAILIAQSSQDETELMREYKKAATQIPHPEFKKILNHTLLGVSQKRIQTKTSINLSFN